MIRQRLGISRQARSFKQRPISGGVAARRELEAQGKIEATSYLCRYGHPGHKVL